MTPKEIIDIVLQLVAVVFIYANYRRSKKNGKTLTQHGEALEIVRKEVNGQSEQLLKVTGEAEHAKGVKEEHDRKK